ncbi:HesA/MoeB/ThiF family protein [Methylotetracoccus oryzae]|uniref:HesA/MoeB/ThiF family protein n=1 Tax=Methylotetracoccus oryzae TaxID=1919059 RepID=UPI001119FD92|nr:molybdopterin-synthase adenylyltransferase MoeB [Methylotetracoccus oryzae]
MHDEQLLRYSRQIMLSEVDIEGQEKLLASRVLIVGAGGLGSPAAMYLAAAGVGTLVLADDDRVDLSNLQRQILHHTDQIGQAKVESAANTLYRLNPDPRVIGIPRRLGDGELAVEAAQADVVLDCSDNFATRFAVNAACVAARTPLISGAVIRFEGQLAVFDARLPDAPCYHCLYPETPQTDLDQSCVRSGVIAPLPGLIGSFQALEAIRLLLDLGEPSTGRLLVFDALAMEWHTLRLRRHPRCPTCGQPVADT